ncbi:MAG: hypothetical protein EOM40_04430 [Clostridia bacterium]|nr:hypothetical protein [Clostridia bacterium]
MKNNIWKLAAVVLMIAALLAGCGSKKDGETDGKENGQGNTATGEETTSKEDGDDTKEDASQETPMKAVLLKNEYGEVFVDLEQESPFFGTIPDAVYDEKDEQIGEADMRNGDVYLVYGDQIMMNSYPGQYPGITKLVRQEEANEEYIEKYAGYLAQFCPEPDTTTPPELSIEYSQPDALVSASITRGGYQWQTMSEDGEAQSEIADSAHVLDWGEDMIDITLADETKLAMHFTYEPQSVEVISWPVGERRSEESTSEYPEGEAVKVEQGEEGFSFNGEAGRVYQVTGTWTEGTVTYGFYTEAIE